MAKKQKSFADKASGRGADADAVMVKYVKSVKSEKTGFWRFNEQMVKLRDGEDLNAALKRCLLYTSPSPRDRQKSRMPSSA